CPPLLPRGIELDIGAWGGAPADRLPVRRVDTDRPLIHCNAPHRLFIVPCRDERLTDNVRARTRGRSTGTMNAAVIALDSYFSAWHARAASEARRPGLPAPGGRRTLALSTSLCAPRIV